MSFIDAKPSDSKEQLLLDIFAAANQAHVPGLPLRPFAALVVKVADETAQTVADLKAHITTLNEQNAKLQWWVVVLAVAALIGTAVQTGAAIYALSASSSPAASTTSPARSDLNPQALPPPPAESAARSTGTGAPTPLPSSALSVRQ